MKDKQKSLGFVLLALNICMFSFSSSFSFFGENKTKACVEAGGYLVDRAINNPIIGCFKQDKFYDYRSTWLKQCENAEISAEDKKMVEAAIQVCIFKTLESNHKNYRDTKVNNDGCNSVLKHYQKKAKSAEAEFRQFREEARKESEKKEKKEHYLYF